MSHSQMTSSGAIRWSSAEWEGRNIPFFTAQMAENSCAKSAHWAGVRIHPAACVLNNPSAMSVLLDDIAEHLSDGFEGAGLEVRWDEEADVGTGGRGMLGQFDGLEDVRAGRAGLDQRSGLEGPSRIDGDLQEPLALRRAEGPALADEPTDPNPIVVQTPRCSGRPGPSAPPRRHALRRRR